MALPSSEAAAAEASLLGEDLADVVEDSSAADARDVSVPARPGCSGRGPQG